MRAQDAQESQAAQEAHQAEVKKNDHIESGMGIFPGFGSDFGSRSQELEAAQEVEGAEAAQPAVAATEAAPPSPSSQPLGQMGTPERSSAPTAPPNTPATPQAPQGSPDAKESDSESELRRLRRLRRLETPPETSPHASDASDASGSKCSEGTEGNMLPVVLPPADLPLEALQKNRFWTPQTPGKKGKRFWTPSCQHSFALGQIPEEEPPLPDWVFAQYHRCNVRLTPIGILYSIMADTKLVSFEIGCWHGPGAYPICVVPSPGNGADVECLDCIFKGAIKLAEAHLGPDNAVAEVRVKFRTGTSLTRYTISITPSGDLQISPMSLCCDVELIAALMKVTKYFIDRMKEGRQTPLVEALGESTGPAAAGASQGEPTAPAAETETAEVAEAADAPSSANPFKRSRTSPGP